MFAVMAASGSNAFAQDSNAFVLEEIVVTAQKRDQLMQDVPIALSVVTAADIENRSIADFSELTQLMPNTAIDQSIASIPAISIRGVSSNVNNIGIESGVGVAVDDVFLGRPSMFSTNLIDIERVEVLRGPQGTLFGKNTIGGLVNIVTRKPSMQGEGSVDLTYGERDLAQVRGFVNGPLVVDRLAGKVSFTVRQQDGWVRNRNPQADDLHGTEFWGARGQLLGQFGDGGSWLLSAEYSEDDAPENYLDVFSGPLTAFDGDPFDRSIETSENDRFTREIYGISMKVDWTWGELDLVSVTAARGIDWTGHNDQDYSSVRLFETGRTEEQEQISQEFRLLGGDESFSWIAGLYYFSQTQDAQGPLILDSDLPLFFGITNPADPLFPIWQTYQERANTISSIDTDSFAAFFSGTWAPGDRWSLTAGARFTDEEKDFAYEQTNEVFELFPGVPVNLIGGFFPAVPPVTDNLGDSDWSGDLSVSYSFSDRVSMYGKVSRGFKAGGFDSTLSESPDPGSLKFTAETLVSYELGFKSMLAGDRVRFNAAAFHYDYSDKQEQFFNGSVFIINNAAEAAIDGLELDVLARLTSSLTLGATLGIQDGSYDAYLDPNSGIDYSGNDLPKVADRSAALTMQYERALANDWTWMLRADAAYLDEMFLQPDNDPGFIAESSTLVNARMSLSSPGDRYSFAVWAKNALDEDYIRAKQANPALATEWTGLNPPRTWGLEFRMNFGSP
jgi:iron complex outermembrane receptor protein